MVRVEEITIDSTSKNIQLRELKFKTIRMAIHLMDNVEGDF